MTSYEICIAPDQPESAVTCRAKNQIIILQCCESVANMSGINCWNVTANDYSVRAFKVGKGRYHAVPEIAFALRNGIETVKHRVMCFRGRRGRDGEVPHFTAQLLELGSQRVLIKFQRSLFADILREALFYGAIDGGSGEDDQLVLILDGHSTRLRCDVRGQSVRGATSVDCR